MARKTLVRNQDQFLVRLPDGMRDRIKAKADRANISMNEAIVWVLEREFPAPMTLQERTHDLLRLVEALKAGASADSIADVTDEVHTVLTEISEGRIKVDNDVRSGIREALQRWWEDQAEYQRDQEERPWDFEETPVGFSRLPLDGKTPDDD
jgi:hypothetical protein